MINPHDLKKAETVWPPPSSAISLPAYEAWLANTPDLISGPGSITWQVNGEIVLVLGWLRAILMQVAHPKVAAGVSEHSTFSRSFAAKYHRFYRTQHQMLRWTFGTPEQVWQAAQHIDKIHARVNSGSVQHQYTARDPELLKWVHATFVDSMLKTYALYVRPLSDAEKNDYVLKASIVGPLLGGSFPTTVDELESYIADMLHSGDLEVSQQALELAEYLLEDLPLPVLGRFVMWCLKIPTTVLLPRSLRSVYGLYLKGYYVPLLKSVAWLSRQAHEWLPGRLHRWKMAWDAEHAAAPQRIKSPADPS